ncbi:glycosyl hydrolase [uncultured Alistipes sp.]|uniref:glycosyl hydrolase n=1 Tax=uncultured Alistipes sp. TaxID=538949 RepID=UPI00266ED71E|nr:glycosyl hydrolase [uncultured Alistipes sp.]
MRRLLLTLALLAAATAAATPPARPEHKPYVRWWWLGSAVDAEGLDRNLAEFARKGIGGVEITPIYGVRGNEANDLAYLSPAWMEAYKHAVTRAAELGLQVDMNNGTGWPFGGPWITTDHSAQKYILETRRLLSGRQLGGPLLPGEEKQRPVAVLQALQAVSDKGKRLDLTDLVMADGSLDWQAPEGEWTLYALWAGRTFQKVKRAAPGGEGLVLNHYNRAAVEHYLARFDEAFGSSEAPWPDTFFNDSFEVYGSSWDTTLLEQFERDHGYRLQDFLPEFAAAGADERSARVVHDYRQTLANMLLHNFTETWTAWAHARGVRIRNQAHGSPGNIFDFYAAVDIPECESFGRTEFDIPGLRSDPAAKRSDADPAVLKFASSAAHVTGKRLTSCETLTWLTEHFRTSLARCKPEIDQILASGVNHVYFHGAPYSPADIPFPGWLFYASINLSPTATLWRDAEGMLGYVARCQKFLQAGTPDNDVLLYIPMDDIGDANRGKNLLLFDIHKMDRTMPGLKRTMNATVRGGYDADYISDLYLQGVRAEDGNLVTEAGTRYKALLLPDVRLIPHTTLSKVLELARQGATVVFLERYPEDVAGLANLKKRRKALRKLTRQLPAADFGALAEHRFGRGRILTGSDLPELLAATGAANEPLKKHGCQLLRRNSETGGKRYFFSLLGGTALDGWYEIGTPAAQVVLTDPLTGRRGTAASRPTGRGTTEIYLQLEPGQSLLLETRADAEDGTPAWRYAGTAGPAIEGRGWQLDFPQSLPTVTQRFSIAEPHSWTTLVPLSSEESIGKIPHPDDNGIAALNAAAQQKAHSAETERALADMVRLCGTGRYSAIFTVPDPTAADSWVLDLGALHESARVRVNGHEAGIAWSVPFRLEVGRWLRAGDNRIEIEVTNLPANFIADLDRRGVEWRIFKDANIVSAQNGPLDTSSWPLEPSGLGGPVRLIPVTTKNTQ